MDFESRARCGSSLSDARLRRGELAHPLVLPPEYFLARQVFLVRGECPAVSLRIDHHAASISPELILNRAHGPRWNFRTGRDRALEECVYVVHVNPQRSGRPAEGLWSFVTHLVIDHYR